MFSKHVTKDLSAYCHGELPAKQSREIAEHLIGCPQCRGEFEEIKLGAQLASHLPTLEAPASLWNDLEVLIEKQDDRKSAYIEPAKSRFGTWQTRFAAVAAILVLAIGFAAFWVYRQESRASWEVARLDGAPRIGSTRIDDKSRLAVGQWLETDSVSRAKINVSSIGNVEIDPNTRVRLVETRATEHRLELARGRLSARIWAPPRLFFVDTPSAVAADLGCAYTLEVDDTGASLLRVTSGWVALQLKDIESIVPAGAACATRPGIGPGTPYFEDASEGFRSALAQLDFQFEKATEGAGTLETLLRESRPRDTLTLWHLLYRVDGAERVLVYERMAALIPPPAGVTREGVLQLDENMLHLWKGQMENTWINYSGVRKAWINVWTRALGKVQGLEGKR